MHGPFRSNNNNNNNKFNTFIALFTIIDQKRFTELTIDTIIIYLIIHKSCAKLKGIKTASKQKLNQIHIVQQAVR